MLFPPFSAVQFSGIIFRVCTAITKTFSSPQTETLLPLSNSSQFPPPPSPWQPLIYFLSLRFLPTLDISCKWNHTIFVFLWLAYFTQENILKGHPLWLIAGFYFLLEGNMIPFYVWITFCLSVHPSMDSWVVPSF